MARGREFDSHHTRHFPWLSGRAIGQQPIGRGFDSRWKTKALQRLLTVVPGTGFGAWQQQAPDTPPARLERRWRSYARQQQPCVMVRRDASGNGPGRSDCARRGSFPVRNTRAPVERPGSRNPCFERDLQNRLAPKAPALLSLSLGPSPGGRGKKALLPAGEGWG